MDIDLRVDRQQRAVVPHFDQFLGVWAMDERAFLAQVEWCQKLVVLNQLEMHIHGPQAAAAREQAAEGALYPVSKEGIARIDLRGTLTKQASSFNESGSTVLARRKLRLAVGDSEVGAIALVIDSPGGTVAGTKELADEVAAARKKKPVYAFIEDLGASAAYWIASQATHVFANDTGLVGSIGTFGVVRDLSGMAAKEGIKVHVVRAGAFKGAGEPGTEVSAEFLAHYQTIINDLNEQFLSGVSAGRGMKLEQVRTLADGRVHIAAKAKELGLVDGVQSLDATLKQLAQVSARPSKKGSTMSSETTAPAAATKPAAATIGQIRAACKGCDEKFILAQLEKGATLEAAKDAWIEQQQTALEAARQETESARAAANKPGVPKLASETVRRDGEAAGGSALDQFEAAVADEMARTKCEQHVAHRRVCEKQPELRDAMVAAYNAQNIKPRRRAS
jgi:signal peptide peptidase SppA